MIRRDVTAVVLLGTLLPGWARAAFSESEAAQGVRAALERGALAAVSQLGRSGGFLDDPKVRITLPGVLKDAAKLLRFTGQQGEVDALVTGMNRAAEKAVPAARTLFVSTAKQISVDDAVQVVRGGPTSVTDYFARKTRTPLTLQFLPIVTQETSRLALADRYNAIAGKVAGFGLLSEDDANVQRYVTARALDGLYLVIGQQEKQLRADPVGTGSAILRRVFGG